MIHAYDKLYLERARTTLAGMLDYAVSDLHFDLTRFFDLFIASGIARGFEAGDPNLTVGKSGVELAYEVLDRVGLSYSRVEQHCSAGRSEEYWTGWAIAYYQWENGITFSDILRFVSINEIRAMYTPYHEMDIRQFVDHLNEQLRFSNYESNLKQLRRRAGMSQSKLAAQTGIPLRTIQQYEQRRKNINKAQAEYIINLASALSCEPEALLEVN